jgi:hypothetical protein
MRALCGAIITAGALIGLGLTALGVGTRYQFYSERSPEGDVVLTHHRFRELDTSLQLIIVVLLATLAIGLATAFLGLAYHHHRRHREMLRDMAAANPPPRVAT